MQNFAVPTDRLWYKTYEKYDIRYNFDIPNHINSLADVFDDLVVNFRHNAALTFMDKSMTYAELDRYSLKIAAYLQSLGLEKGDKVAVMMPNIPQYLVAMFGIVRAGFVLVNVNPLYTAHELEHQLNDSDAKVLFILDNFAKTFEGVKNKDNIQKVIVTGIGDMLGLIKGTVVNLVVRHIKKMVPSYHIDGVIGFKDAMEAVPASSYKRPQLTLDDVVVLQYTGGTTGVAKGAMLTHKNLIANVEQAGNFVKTAFANDVTGQYVTIALPMYHIFCFMVSLLAMKIGFSLLLIPNARDFDDLTKQHAKYRPAFFIGVNTLFNALCNHEGFKNLNHSNLKFSLAGGMAVLPSTADAWETMTGCYITEGYGLSETSPVLTVTPPPAGYSGKIGIPLPNTDIKLLDDDGNEVPFGEAGEICAKGPQVMKGYYKRDDETAKVMTADGYFRTGDIGVFDENGYVKIVDRKKDMILVSGFNVYPNEVEEAISAHAKVLECGVIGVPDGHSGECVKVFIVKKDSSLTEEEVKKWAKQQLTGYKRPKHIEFVAELPKSNVGKILRKDLRKLEESKKA